MTLLSLTIAAIISSPAAPIELEKVLAEGDTAYARGDYSRAIEIYKAAESSYGTSAELLFNLGNACYKDGDDGQAMLCYRRAYRLDPSNKRIVDNLQFLQSRVDDANRAELGGKKGNVTTEPLSFLGRVSRKISTDTTSDYWGVLGAMSFILFLFTVAVYLFATTVNLKKIGFFSAIIMLIFSVIFICFALTAAHASSSRDEAVLTGFKTELMEEPEVGAHITGTPLHRGTTFEIIESVDGPDGKPAWYKVRLNSDNVGWVKSEDLEII